MTSFAAGAATFTGSLKSPKVMVMSRGPLSAGAAHPELLGDVALTDPHVDRELVDAQLRVLLEALLALFAGHLAAS